MKKKQIPDIMESLKSFLLPVVKALINKESEPGYWKAPGPWQ